MLFATRFDISTGHKSRWFNEIFALADATRVQVCLLLYALYAVIIGFCLIMIEVSETEYQEYDTQCMYVCIHFISDVLQTPRITD